MPDAPRKAAERAQSEQARTLMGNQHLRESGMLEKFPHLTHESLPVKDIRLTECNSGAELTVSTWLSNRIVFGM
jgi:hypothetical protein